MGLALSGLAAPALAQAKTKVRVGYLHTLAVDGQIWTGMDQGLFDKQGLELELRQFNLQLALSRARALRKNVEDERGAIKHFAVEHAFQVSALGR